MNEQHLITIFKVIKDYNWWAEEYLQDYLYPKLATLDIASIKQHIYYAHVNGYIHWLQPDLTNNEIKAIDPLSLTEKWYHYIHSHNFFYKYRYNIIITLASVGCISGISSLCIVLFSTTPTKSLNFFQADLFQKPNQNIKIWAKETYNPTKEITDKEIDTILNLNPPTTTTSGTIEKNTTKTWSDLEDFFKDSVQEKDLTGSKDSWLQIKEISINQTPTESVILNPTQTADNFTKIRNSFIEDFYRYLQTQQSAKIFASLDSYLKTNSRMKQFSNTQRLSTFFKNIENTFSLEIQSFEDDVKRTTPTKSVKKALYTISYTFKNIPYKEQREMIIVKRLPENIPLVNSLQCLSEKCSKNPFFK